jgi:hypothetical protein
LSRSRIEKSDDDPLDVGLIAAWRRAIEWMAQELT